MKHFQEHVDLPGVPWLVELIQRGDHPDVDGDASEGGLSWVFIDAHGFSWFPWIFIGFHGFSWIFMDFHGFFMGFHGFSMRTGG